MSWIELVAQRRPPSAPPGMTPPENAKDWFRIENSADDAESTDVFVYDSIGGWFGMYADEFIEAIGQVTTKNINLRLNSPGGSVFEGIAIANAIRSHPANITVYVDSLAASIASIIALSGDKLVMMPQSQLMIHDASGGCYGNAAEMEYMRNLLEKQSDNIASAYADAAGGTKAEWRDRMRDETWFTAEEAVAIGLADEVMKKPKKNDDSETADDVTVSDKASIYERMTAAWDLTGFKYAGREKAPAPAAALPAITITASAPLEAPPAPASEDLSQITREELLDLVREAVRAELATAEESSAPAEEVEDQSADTVHAETDDNQHVEDASQTSTPPPDQEDEPDEENPDTEPDEDDNPEDEAQPKDEWSSLVARLTDSPSSSADDVFNSLKEAW